MSVLVVELESIAPAGLALQWLSARGQDAVVAGPERLRDVGQAQALIVLGSSASIYDHAVPWRSSVLGLLYDALRRDVPVLGLCFGAQALAVAAGGEVGPAARPEIGWISCDGEVPLGGQWFTWHRDAVTRLPVGARELASNAHATQAFAFGPHLGVQFHPEVTAAIAAAWIADDPDAVRAAGADPEHLAAQVAEREDDLRRRAFDLLDWWWQGMQSR